MPGWRRGIRRWLLLAGGLLLAVVAVGIFYPVVRIRSCEAMLAARTNLDLAESSPWEFADALDERGVAMELLGMPEDVQKTPINVNDIENGYLLQFLGVLFCTTVNYDTVEMKVVMVHFDRPDLIRSDRIGYFTQEQFAAGFWRRILIFWNLVE